MYSKAKIGSHPIHPMLVAFPITFYTLTLISFIVYAFVSPTLFWYRLAVFSNYAGVGTAVLASIPGMIDWSAGIPKNTAAKTRGALHMVLNVTTLVLFAINLIVLRGTWDLPRQSVGLPLILSLIGVVLTLMAGYHGWELIARHKVGVDLTPEQERLQLESEMRPRGTTTTSTASPSSGYHPRPT